MRIALVVMIRRIQLAMAVRSSETRLTISLMIAAGHNTVALKSQSSDSEEDDVEYQWEVMRDRLWEVYGPHSSVSYVLAFYEPLLKLDA